MPPRDSGAVKILLPEGNALGGEDEILATFVYRPSSTESLLCVLPSEVFRVIDSVLSIAGDNRLYYQCRLLVR